MKKVNLIVLLCILCLTGVMTGCNTGNSADDKITIVCTNFPLYDWTSRLLGESEAEVILLLNNGADMHSFQPSAEEMIQIANCDMLVHIGGESDAWLEDALEANPKEERIVVNLMDVLKEDVLEEQYVEGMQTEHTHEEENVCETEHDHNEAVSDEHIWLSLRMAVKSCGAIEKALCQLIPAEAEQIHNNSNSYYGELADLDQKYADMVANHADHNTVIVADRFPFLYLMEDYGLEYYAAFPGCSTESEADFETVVFLAEKVKEQENKVLFITESGTDTLANTVFDNINVTGETAVLHSMQVVYQSDIEAGASYLGYMEENLAVLEQVLR
ncbi:MAG: zinc ABC transporter substrate-binding protein [Lachnospiraceae bacterium]|nr:zinc ABC transporter substrate-binding protein [Lachnospiraceae bacterium]